MKTVIVTGGSRGIGKCIAENLAKEGYNVVLNYNKSVKEAKKTMYIGPTVISYGLNKNTVYEELTAGVKDLIEKKRIKYTELKPKEDFLYKMLEKRVHKRDGTIQYGYGAMQLKNAWRITPGERAPRSQP